MRKSENRTSIIVRKLFPEVRRVLTKRSNPTAAKLTLHNYFAAKMASFSTILGYVFKKAGEIVSEQTNLTDPMVALHHKLLRMQSSFLSRYHELNSLTRIHQPMHSIKAVFKHIYLFEKSVISEVINAGVYRPDLLEFNNVSFLLISSNNDSKHFNRKPN